MKKGIRSWWVLFLVSSMLVVVLIGLSTLDGSIKSIMAFAGIMYTILSICFLGVMAWVFVLGHIGGVRDIENPKMDIFAMEYDVQEVKGKKNQL